MASASDLKVEFESRWEELEKFAYGINYFGSARERIRAVKELLPAVKKARLDNLEYYIKTLPVLEKMALIEQIQIYFNRLEQVYNARPGDEAYGSKKEHIFWIEQSIKEAQKAGCDTRLIESELGKLRQLFSSREEKISE